MLYILEAKLLFSGMYKIIINMHQNKWGEKVNKKSTLSMQLNRKSGGGKETVKHLRN